MNTFKIQVYLCLQNKTMVIRKNIKKIMAITLYNFLFDVTYLHCAGKQITLFTARTIRYSNIPCLAQSDTTTCKQPITPLSVVGGMKNNQPVRLLISASPNQPANSVFLS